MNRFVPVLLMLLTALSLNAGALKSGSQIKQLPVANYIDDSAREFSSFLGSKFVVLFIWEMNPQTLSEFYRVGKVAEQFRNEVNFVGIGLGEHDRIKRYPGALQLGFPVSSDPRRAAEQLFVRDGDSLPLMVVMDKNGTLLWRGKLRNLSRVLKECIDGKFNLSEQIRLEEFAGAVNAAVRNNELDKALELLKSEYELHPEKQDLLNARISLLKKLERIPEIYTLLHDAQKRFPANYRLYEMEYRTIGEADELDKLPEFFGRLKKNFAEKPDILIAFAIAECKLPPDKLNLVYALDLAATGWAGQKFESAEKRGMYALDYASILHSIGRNDLAVTLVKQACEDLKSRKKAIEQAQTALIYYTKLSEIAAKVKLPPLKK